MALYMTQKMSSANTTDKVYYRKQTQPHVTHVESGKFTTDAKANYAEFNHITTDDVVEGAYKSGQGIPDVPNAYEI